MGKDLGKKPRLRGNRKVRSGAREIHGLVDLGIFTVADAQKANISRPTLSRLVVRGEVIRLERGLYRHRDANVAPETEDFAVACAKFGPKSVIGGPTALFHYNLVEQVPGRLWIMVPYGVKTVRALYRCVRTKTNPAVGIDDFGIYRITNLERTIIEALRYASKIGLATAIKAARLALTSGRTNEVKLYKQAEALGLKKYVVKYWESITA